MVREQANAKINLFLDVLSCREDGFHNIKSVMHSVLLSDFLTVSASDSEDTEIVVHSSTSDLPSGKDNLVYRAADKYLCAFKKNAFVEIYIEKNIPIGAGLAGGSSDAAATLRALNKIFGLATQEELLRIASEIGSDVSFCLVGGTALCEGRGEIITTLSSPKIPHLVIAIGEERVSTPIAYRALDEMYSNGFEDKSSICDRLISSFANGNIDTTALYNIFEDAVKLSEIDKIKENMIKNKAEAVLMSGSGPSVFGIFDSEAAAKTALAELSELGFDAYYAPSASKGESV